MVHFTCSVKFLISIDSHRQHAADFPTNLREVHLIGGLARAPALQGIRSKARAAYEDFLTQWKDADPDIPVLHQAKSEYAKLQ